jgi:hypothetical protein
MTTNSTRLNSTAPTAPSERPGFSRRALKLDLMRKGEPDVIVPYLMTLKSGAVCYSIGPSPTANPLLHIVIRPGPPRSQPPA